MRASRGIPFTPPSNAQRQESASAGVYVQKRTRPTRLLHIYISRVERTVIRPGTYSSSIPYLATPQGRRRACSFVSAFSCKSSARSIRSSFPWRAPTFIRALPDTPTLHRPRLVSRNNLKLPFPVLLSFSRSARALAYCLSVSDCILPKQPALCTSTSGDANASPPPRP